MNTPRSVPTNTTEGSEKVRYECHIDWLQFTVDYLPNMSAIDSVTCRLGDVLQGWSGGEELTSVRGYDAGCKIGHASVYWHTRLQSQKILVVLSGHALSSLAKSGQSQEWLLANTLVNAANITRVDFAVDLYNTGADPNDLVDMIGTKRVTTKARHMMHVNGYDMGDGRMSQSPTVYIGHSSSDRQLRVYNKGHEQGLEIDWIRIELVTRKPLALPLVQAMVRTTIQSAGRTAIRGFADFRVAWYEQAVESDMVLITPVIEPDRKTRLWLVKVAIPVLAREAKAEQQEGGNYLTDLVVRLARELTHVV